MKDRTGRVLMVMPTLTFALLVNIGLATIDYSDGTQQPGVLYGVSVGDDPTGSWHVWFDAESHPRYDATVAARIATPPAKTSIHIVGGGLLSSLSVNLGRVCFVRAATGRCATLLADAAVSMLE